MFKFYCFILFITIIPEVSFAQIPKEYLLYVSKADSLYKCEKYKDAAENYSLAFKSIEWKAYEEDRYKSVCCWAEAGILDSAFHQLNLLLTRNLYENFEQIKAESHFRILRSDRRWQNVSQIIEKEEKKFNIPLKKILDSILLEDQRYRNRIDSINKAFGMQSPESISLWKQIKKTDSSNFYIVSQIISRYGWLGSKDVGKNANSALFLVIQHSDLQIQEKYLPIMREAVKMGKAEGRSLALLIDRIEMRNGRKQIYGSQIQQNEEGTFFIYPIEDEKNVNIRRAEMGLGSLEDYVSYWGIIYHLPEN